MVVFQETRDADNNLELRLFLNGKTYTEIWPWSPTKGRNDSNVDYEDTIGTQVMRDYKQYPETADFFDIAGYGMRYGMIAHWVLFLYGGCKISWAVKELYELEQKWLVRERAEPLHPAKIIPEMKNIRYRRSFHHDGSVEETMFYTHEESPY